MTRVRTSARQAEVTATEQERDREAWNLPRKPVGAESRASSHSQAAAPRDESATSPWRATSERSRASAQDHSATDQDLEWERFSAAHVPGSRRRNAAMTAYGAYERSRAVDGQSIADATRSNAAERISMGTAAVDAWEDEGGASP